MGNTVLRMTYGLDADGGAIDPDTSCLPVRELGDGGGDGGDGGMVGLFRGAGFYVEGQDVTISDLSLYGGRTLYAGWQGNGTGSIGSDVPLNDPVVCGSVWDTTNKGIQLDNRYSISNVVIDAVEVSNFGGELIYGGYPGSTGNVVQNCLLHNTMGDGVSACDGITITGNEIYQCGANGVEDTAENVGQTITQNYIHDSLNGISIAAFRGDVGTLYFPLVSLTYGQPVWTAVLGIAPYDLAKKDTVTIVDSCPELAGVSFTVVQTPAPDAGPVLTLESDAGLGPCGDAGDTLDGGYLVYDTGHALPGYTISGNTLERLVSKGLYLLSDNIVATGNALTDCGWVGVPLTSLTCADAGAGSPDAGNCAFTTEQFVATNFDESVGLTAFGTDCKITSATAVDGHNAYTCYNPALTGTPASLGSLAVHGSNCTIAIANPESDVTASRVQGVSVAQNSLTIDQHPITASLSYVQGPDPYGAGLSITGNTLTLTPNAVASGYTGDLSACPARDDASYYPGLVVQSNETEVSSVPLVSGAPLLSAAPCPLLSPGYALVATILVPASVAMSAYFSWYDASGAPQTGTFTGAPVGDGAVWDAGTYQASFMLDAQDVDPTKPVELWAFPGASADAGAGNAGDTGVRVTASVTQAP